MADKPRYILRSSVPISPDEYEAFRQMIESDWSLIVLEQGMTLEEFGKPAPHFEHPSLWVEPPQQPDPWPFIAICASGLALGLSIITLLLSNSPT